MRLALAGDTMLGRGVAERLREVRPETLVAPEIVEITRDADAFVLNLECCISDRGEPWPAPGKPFFFRAPPVAVDLLAHLGTTAVTLANNHALDFGNDALEDTLRLLAGADIAVGGAGRDLDEARRPVELRAGDERVRIVALTDHPRDFAASDDAPGVAFADLRKDALPPWVRSALERSDADVTFVSPHWGPNMSAEPVSHVVRSARRLVGAGATLVAGHSAHIFQGVAPPVIFDLGDFLDDYAVDPVLRNDLGLLFVAQVSARAVSRVEAVPIALDYCHTRLASAEEARWIERRLRDLCEPFGTTVRRDGGRLVVSGDGAHFA